MIAHRVTIHRGLKKNGGFRVSLGRLLERKPPSIIVCQHRFAGQALTPAGRVRLPLHLVLHLLLDVTNDVVLLVKGRFVA